MSMSEVQESMEATLKEIDQQVAVMEKDRDALGSQITQKRRDRRSLERVMKNMGFTAPSEASPEPEEE